MGPKIVIIVIKPATTRCVHRATQCNAYMCTNTSDLLTTMSWKLKPNYGKQLCWTANVSFVGSVSQCRYAHHFHWLFPLLLFCILLCFCHLPSCTRTVAIPAQVDINAAFFLCSSNAIMRMHATHDTCRPIAGNEERKK